MSRSSGVARVHTGIQNANFDAPTNLKRQRGIEFVLAPGYARLRSKRRSRRANKGPTRRSKTEWELERYSLLSRLYALQLTLLLVRDTQSEEGRPFIIAGSLQCTDKTASVPPPIAADAASMDRVPAFIFGAALWTFILLQPCSWNQACLYL